MKRAIYLLLAIVIISSFCISNAHAGLLPTQEEKKAKREASIKEVKEVDLPVLRDRAKFLKQKLEELKAKGEKEISCKDTIGEGIQRVVSAMYDYSVFQGLPTRMYGPDKAGLFLTKYNIEQCILKLEEAITIINSLIGPEKAK